MARHTAELVAFPGCKQPDPPSTNDEVVCGLERLLDMARRGELTGYAIGCILVDGGTQTQILCEDGYLHRCVAVTALVHRYAIDHLTGTSKLES